MTPGDLQSTNGLTVASTRAARRDQHDSGTTATPGDIVINLDGTYPGEKSSWDVAEVLLYDGNLDAADISALETYLIDKYGLDLRVNGVKCDRNFRRLTCSTHSTQPAREKVDFTRIVFSINNQVHTLHRSQ
jgi:hypothetical protein